MNKLHVVRLDFKKSFTIYAGGNSRGIKLMLKYTKGLTIKNYIKIENKLYETECSNVTDNSVDILFPALKDGEYEAEIVIYEGSDDNLEILKSGVYKIIVNRSLIYNETSKLKEMNTDDLYVRLVNYEERAASILPRLERLAGTVDNNYLHRQVEPAKDWIIKHDLDKYPSVTVILDSGEICEGDKTYISKDVIKISFSRPISGMATLN